MPDLSVITINYNNKPGLEKTFASVFSQAFTNFEYFVIDGGSTDGSTSVILQYAGRITRWISEMDSGIYDAMNKGILLATGKYLIFLNSGDCFCNPHTLEHCMQYRIAHPDTDIFYANIYLVKNGSQANKELYTHPARLSLVYFKENVPNHQASLIKAALFKEFGLYPEQYKLAGDYWVYLQTFLAGKIYTFMNFVMVDFDANGVSLTQADKYITERSIAWKTLVPWYAQDILAENEALKTNVKHKIVRGAIQLHAKYRQMKKFIKKCNR